MEIEFMNQLMKTVIFIFQVTSIAENVFSSIKQRKKIPDIAAVAIMFKRSHIYFYFFYSFFRIYLVVMN